MSMSDHLLRQWLLLRQIPRAPRKIDTARLAAHLDDHGLKVTRRTIQRDLIGLSALFPLTSDDRSKPYGWSWVRDAGTLEVPAMAPATAAALELVGRFMRSLLPPSVVSALSDHLQRAEDVLRSLQDNPLSEWSDKVRVLPSGMPRQAPPVDALVLRAVYEALLHSRQLDVTYRRRGASRSKRYVVNPLGLVVREPILYLVSAGSDGDVFQHVLHRMIGAKVTDTPVKCPTRFSLDEYIVSGHFGVLWDEEAVPLKALMHPAVSQRLAEAPIGLDQALSDLGDRVLLEVTVPDNQELRVWLLGHGETVEVVGPDWLRKELAATTDRVASAYRSPP